MLGISTIALGIFQTSAQSLLIKMRLIKYFIFGSLAAMGALCVELLISNLYLILFEKNIATDYLNRLTLFLIIVVLTEEISKYILLAKIYSLPNKKPRPILTGIFTGLGFSFVELFFLTQNTALNNFNFNFLITTLLHLSTATLISLLLLKKNISALKIISLAFVLHLGYNIIIVYSVYLPLIHIYLATLTLIIVLVNFNSNKLTG